MPSSMGNFRRFDVLGKSISRSSLRSDLAALTGMALLGVVYGAAPAWGAEGAGHVKLRHRHTTASESGSCISRGENSSGEASMCCRLNHKPPAKWCSETGDKELSPTLNCRIDGHLARIFACKVEKTCTKGPSTANSNSLNRILDAVNQKTLPAQKGLYLNSDESQDLFGNGSRSMNATRIACTNQLVDIFNGLLTDSKSTYWVDSAHPALTVRQMLDQLDIKHFVVDSYSTVFNKGTSLEADTESLTSVSPEIVDWSQEHIPVMGTKISYQRDFRTGEPVDVSSSANPITLDLTSRYDEKGNCLHGLHQDSSKNFSEQKSERPQQIVKTLVAQLELKYRMDQQNAPAPVVAQSQPVTAAKQLDLKADQSSNQVSLAPLAPGQSQPSQPPGSGEGFINEGSLARPGQLLQPQP